MNKQHLYDKNLVCRCGRTFEQHQRINLVNEKWRMNNFEGKVNVKKMFKEIEEVLSLTPSK